MIAEGGVAGDELSGEESGEEELTFEHTSECGREVCGIVEEVGGGTEHLDEVAKDLWGVRFEGAWSSAVEVGDVGDGGEGLGMDGYLEGEEGVFDGVAGDAADMVLAKEGGGVEFVPYHDGVKDMDHGVGTGFDEGWSGDEVEGWSGSGLVEVEGGVGTLDEVGGVSEHLRIEELDAVSGKDVVGVHEEEE